MSLTHTLTATRQRVAAALPATRPDLAALLLRLALGLVLLSHGLLKVLVFTLPGTAGFFTSVGFPGWLAYPVTAVEVAGGLLLLLGWQVRLVALLSLPVLLGATWVHLPNGWLFSSTNGGWEYPLLLSLLAVAVLLAGEGAYALSRSGGQPGQGQADTPVAAPAA